MVWQGMIPKEGLKEESLLNWVRILKTEKEKYKIEIEDEIKEDFVKNAIKSLEEGYYIHIVKEGIMYVIFKDHMFKFSKGYPELDTAREYGKFQGILTKQMPFEYFLEHPLG